MSHSAYQTISQALSLPERSDRVMALHDALRTAPDRDELMAAIINRLADKVHP